MVDFAEDIMTILTSVTGLLQALTLLLRLHTFKVRVDTLKNSLAVSRGLIDQS